MTVSTTTSRIQYNGNDVATAFAFPYKFIEDADLVVVLTDSAGTDTELTLSTHYTVSGAGTDSSGAVTMITAPASGEVLTIYRSILITQETDYISGDAFPAETHEAALDKLTLISQDLQTQVNRTIKIGETISGVTTTLPAPEAGKHIAWNSTATGLVNDDAPSQTVGAAYTDEIQVATEGQTVFTLTGFTYTPGVRNLSVYINGVRQYAGDSYTETSTTTVTFSSGLNAGDEVLFVTADTVTNTVSSAASVQYQPSGTGAVATNVQDKLRESVSVLDFGAVGDGVSDDTNALQTALDYCMQNQRTLKLGKGTYKITSPLTVDASYYANVIIEGEHYGFTSTIVPYECAAFEFDGTLATGGYCFNIVLRNFTIDNTNVTTAQTHSVLFNSTYRCGMENIRFTSTAVSSSVFSKVVVWSGFCAENYMRRCYVIGTANSGSGSLISVEHTSGNLVLEQIDVENAYNGIYLAANAKCDIMNVYAERCGTSIFIQAGSSPTNTPSVNIIGGSIDIASGTASGIIFNGTFSDNEIININGLRFTSDDHATKRNAFNTGALTWQNVNRIALSNIDWSWIFQPTKLREASAYFPNTPTDILQSGVYQLTIASLADNVATDVFKIEGMTSVGPYIPVYVKIKAFAEHQAYGRALEESVFVLSQRTGNAYFNTKQIIAESRETDSANFSFTTFSMSAIENASDITFQITSDFNSTISATINPYFIVEVYGQHTLTDLT